MCLVSRINLLHFFMNVSLPSSTKGAQVAIRWCWVQNSLSITVEMFEWECLFLVDKEIGVLFIPTHEAYLFIIQIFIPYVWLSICHRLICLSRYVNCLG